MMRDFRSIATLFLLTLCGCSSTEKLTGSRF